MSILLPISSDVRALPLRAIVAYAYRTARRIMFRSEVQHMEGRGQEGH